MIIFLRVKFFISYTFQHYKEEINKAQMTAESIPIITNNEEQMKSLMIEQFSRLSKLNQRWSQE